MVVKSSFADILEARFREIREKHDSQGPETVPCFYGPRQDLQSGRLVVRGWKGIWRVYDAVKTYVVGK